MMQHHIAIISKSWLAIVVLAIGLWLRLWQVDTQGIVFGDAAHDILAAQEAVRAKTLPLLGIESSVPRFKQGPVSVWFSMLLTVLGGSESIGLYLFAFSLVSCATLLIFYEYIVARVSYPAAVAATAVLALSPLAIAHARMPYHVSFLPLATLGFLYSAEKWLDKPNLKRAFVLGLCTALAIQFELSVAPLVLVAPALIWWSWKKQSQSNQPLPYLSLLALGGGLFFGLLPQIIYDITHGFAQLGGFTLWVGYRSVATIYPSGHSWSLSKLLQLWQSVSTYGTRILSFNSLLLALPLVGMVFFGIFKQFSIELQAGKRKIRLQTSSHWKTALLGASGLLSLGYAMHGNPSEAYYPPFFIFLAMWIGIGIDTLPKKLQNYAITIVLLVGVHSGIRIVQSKFFLDGKSFSYGMSVAEQQQIITYISKKSGSDYTLKTTIEAGKFANYFDNLRLIGKLQHAPENLLSQHIFYINPIDETSPTVITQTGLIESIDFTTMRVLYSKPSSKTKND